MNIRGKRDWRLGVNTGIKILINAKAYKALGIYLGDNDFLSDSSEKV